MGILSLPLHSEGSAFNYGRGSGLGCQMESSQEALAKYE
jgi:hypothetical protein